MQASQKITSSTSQSSNQGQPFISNQPVQIANQNQHPITYIPTSVPGVYKQAFTIPTSQVQSVVQKISSSSMVPLQGIGYQVSGLSNQPVQRVTQQFPSNYTLPFQNVLTQASSFSTIPVQSVVHPQFISSTSIVPLQGIIQQASPSLQIPAQINNVSILKNSGGVKLKPRYDQFANNIVNVQPSQLSNSIIMSAPQKILPTNSPGGMLLSDIIPSQQHGINVQEPHIQMPVIADVSSLAFDSFFDKTDFQSASPITKYNASLTNIEKNSWKKITSLSSNSSSSYENPKIAQIRKNIKELENTDTIQNRETDSIINNLISSNNSHVDTGMYLLYLFMCDSNLINFYIP